MPRSIDVVTVGHALIDIRFVVDRFALPDHEARIFNQSRGVGGSAANVAIDVTRLGGRSAAIVKVGLDSFGRMIVDELMREGVDISGVRVCIGDTGFTIVIIDRGGSIVMYGYKGAAEKLEPDDIDESLVSRAKYMHIASLRLDTSIKAAELARKHGLTVSWDPGRLLASKGLDSLAPLLKLVDIVMANKAESEMLTGEKDHRRAAETIASYGPSIVVVKMGARGVYLLDKEAGTELSVPAFKPPQVIDTTGAGDAFAAGFLLGLSRGYNVRKAAIYANGVAALKVSRLGSHEVPSHDEVVRFIWEHGGF